MTPPYLAVIPVLVGPLQVLLALLPAILIAVCGVVISLLRPRAVLGALRLSWRLKWQLTALLVCGVLAVMALRRLGPTRDGDVTSADRGDADWMIFRGGVERRGAIPESSGPNGGGIRWSWFEEDESFFSSAALVGNRVYASSASVSAFSERGAIYCFDATTGAVVWRTEPEGFRPTFSSPSVVGDYLVCGEGLHDTKDARVVCIDLREGPTLGKVLWTFRTGSHVECTPALAGGRVYVGAGDDGYYCLELEPDEGGNARLVWHAPGERYPDAETSLLVRDGRVWCGLGVGGRAICVLDASDGSELHRVETPYPVFSPPAAADGRIFFGMGNGDYVNDAITVRELRLERLREANAAEAELADADRRLAPGGALWCLDEKSFAARWKLELPSTVLGSVAVSGAERTLFVATRAGRIYAVDFDGRILRDWDAHAPIVASPALSDELLYIVTVHGRLFALDPERLDPVWELGLASGGTTISSPSIRRERLYVGTESDGFLCVGARVDERVEPEWSGEHGGAGRGGCVDGSTTPEEGQVEWSLPDLKATGPFAALGGMLFAPVVEESTRPDEAFRGLVCLEVGRESRGHESETRERWRFSTHLLVTSPVAVTRDHVFFIEGSIGDGRRLLHRLGRSDGELRESLEVGPEASGFLEATSEGFCVERWLGTLEMRTDLGEPVWRSDVGELAAPPSRHGAMLLAVTRDTRKIIALDAPTGRILWSRRVRGTPSSSALVDRTRVFVATDRDLACHSLIDGRRVEAWTTDGGIPATALLRAGEDIVFVNNDSELVRVALVDGRVRSRHDDALRGFSVVRGRSTTLYATESGLVRLSLRQEDSTPELWVERAELGEMSTSPVLAGARIFVGTNDRGIVCLGAVR